MKKLILLIALATLAIPAFGQEGWKDQGGHLTQNTESRNSVDEFGGWLVVTSDADWNAKWQTPSDTVPHFTEAKTVARGKEIFVLILFANPLLDSNGGANVTCDLDVTRPDGTSSIHQVGAVCFQGKIKEAPTHLFLSTPVIGFRGDPDDPSGKWVVRVTLKDNVRGAVVPLQSSFVLN
ncbi:hypothetical protein GCM10007862_28810 [Dyella lipolytica]|uniref:Uncharacterized protein n=1 Tax=Dyella lipolytica TaxID=1867835 RepID=A0ABW8IVF8_9GAMM|nr:hypothetical protein [Dyella lipolytica]GLQ47830.1 hypothetical protein GCM10007862_28810 [Dyella lipolytica]